MNKNINININDIDIIHNFTLIDEYTFAPKTIFIYVLNGKVYSVKVSFSAEMLQELKSLGIKIDDNDINIKHLVLDEINCGNSKKELTRNDLETYKIISDGDKSKLISLIRKLKIKNILNI